MWEERVTGTEAAFQKRLGHEVKGPQAAGVLFIYLCLHRAAEVLHLGGPKARFWETCPDLRLSQGRAAQLSAKQPASQLECWQHL